MNQWPSIGIEEELHVVDAVSLMPSNVPQMGELQDAVHPCGVSSEAHRFVVEIQTQPWVDVQRVVSQLTVAREAVRHALESKGLLLAALSLHPGASWEDLERNEDPGRFPHYASIFEEYGELMRSLIVCGTHVHVAPVHPADRVKLMNGLRAYLPGLFALTAGSPIAENRDTSVCSWRHSILDRLPRMGLPPDFIDEHDYWAHVERLKLMQCLGHSSNIWGDVRLHHRYPTVEVRMFDVTAQLWRTELVALLLQLLSIKICGQGSVLPQSRHLYEENKWRARRRGTQCILVDWDRNCSISWSSWFSSLVDELRPLAAGTTAVERLDQLAGLALSQECPAVAMRERFVHQGWEAVVRSCLVDGGGECENTA